MYETYYRQLVANGVDHSTAEILAKAMAANGGVVPESLRETAKGAAWLVKLKK
jgi:hypothetical protein